MAADAVLVGQASGDTDLTTSAGTTTTGSTFVVLISANGGGLPILTVTYTLVDLELDDPHAKAIYRCENCMGGAGHAATVTFTGASFGTAYLVEVTGATAVSFDETASATDGTRPYTVDLAVLSR